ncbi:hypothetical protein [Breoghania sp.]|uniref:hypothetical protein n=1 Tax=Breoghania sp. TaxID=2065378 RepID=UPI00262FBC72|nr:hypothetical protein [Breoghania sp.]MDJ0930912.1 hypothetical protein [Breoghania sp.]
MAGFMGSPPMNMLPGKLVRDGGTFVDAGELHFPLSKDLADRLSIEDGHEVVLGLRPETIFAAGSELPGPDRFIFERPVEAVEPTGPETMLVFTVAETEMIARVRPQDEAPVGAPFRFEVEMGKAKLFDKATGVQL